MNVIKHAGEVRTATLPDGTTVHREERLFVEEWGAFVACAPYQDHFVYLNPDTRDGSPGYLCTCGSVAVVTPPSPTGMFVCMFDLNDGLRGYHSTSLYNKKDIEKVKGQTLDMNKIRRELI